MNDPIAFIIGCIFIGSGLGVGLSCIGDGIKAIAKKLPERGTENSIPLSSVEPSGK